MLGVSHVQHVGEPPLEAIEMWRLDSTLLVGAVADRVRAVEAVWREQVARAVAERVERRARPDDLVVAVADYFRWRTAFDAGHSAVDRHVWRVRLPGVVVEALEPIRHVISIDTRRTAIT